jgi:outer membrane protein insertion porin family
MAATRAGADPLSGAQARPAGAAPVAAGSAPDPKPAPAPATDAVVEPYAERQLRDVQVTGLKRTDAALVNNQIRSRTGQPLSAETVRGDVQRLNRLGRFREINAKITPFDDGSVQLSYAFVETPIIADVQAVGNRQLTDLEIAGEISFLRDTPVDEFQLGRAKRAIEDMYRDKGYYQATVSIDEAELEKSGIVLFRINEGERVRVTAVRFVAGLEKDGALAFRERQLSGAIKTTTAGLFEPGPVDNEQLDKDVAALIEFYRDRGYLDVRADRRVIFSPNGREAIVEFVIDEGLVYTLKGFRVETADVLGSPTGQPPTTFSLEQVAGLMPIKVGDVYSADRIRKSMDEVRNAYARMGYVDAQVGKAEIRDSEKPEVDLLLLVREGERYLTGTVTIRGNDLTQGKVVRRELDNLRPDRPLDASNVRRGGRLVSNTELKLEETRLFEPGSSKVTIQPEDPANPGYRDVLVEVKETNTGSIGFGAGVSSDGGVFGQISLRQRNFDVLDTPDSFGELIAGRAFRGAGQDFNITVAPGDRTQQYSISLADPALFDSDYSGSIAGAYLTREYDEYNEARIRGALGVGRRFGERWAGRVNFRYDGIDITDIEPNSIEDLFEVQGNSSLTGLGFTLTRNTVDSRFRPTKGSNLSLEIERVGLLGGDFNFTKLSAQHVMFFNVYEDFLGYKTILQIKTAAAYIPEGREDAPLFERFYLGGQSFRGFRFRSISPKGIANDTKLISDDPRGGTWSFFMGPEITQPVYKDLVAVAGFIDTGTVTDDIGFSDYRVSAGFGLRLYVDALGPVPLAFDFGFPLVKQAGDRKRIFSFSLELPF